MARVNILKKVKIDGVWTLLSIPRNPKGNHDWTALPEGTYLTEWYSDGKRRRAAARAFREAAVGVRLHAPGDPPEEKLFVIRPARFTEDFVVLLLELPDRHVLQGLDLFPQGR